MPGVGWITILTVLPGLLAFALSRRSGTRAGYIVVLCVAVLNLPTVIGTLGFLIEFARPQAGTSTFLAPVNTSLGATGSLLFGTFSFVVATLTSAILGTLLGGRRSRDVVT